MFGMNVNSKNPCMVLFSFMFTLSRSLLSCDVCQPVAPKEFDESSDVSNFGGVIDWYHSSRL